MRPNIWYDVFGCKYACVQIFDMMFLDVKFWNLDTSAALQASSASMKSGDCPSPTAYWWCLNMYVRRPNASAKPLHVQPNLFSQSSCISVLVEGGSMTLLERFVVDIATRHYRTSQLTPQAQKNKHHKQITNQDNIDQAMIGIVSLLGLSMDIDFWNSEQNLVFCTMEICWLLESKKLVSIVPQQKLGHGDMAPCNIRHN